MNPIPKIVEHITSSFPLMEVSGDGYDSFKCTIQDKLYRIKIKIQREEIEYIKLPHVHDFKDCLYCGTRFRCPYERVNSCKDCRYVKARLLTQGVSQKSMINNKAEYVELVGSVKLLRELKKTIAKVNS